MTAAQGLYAESASDVTANSTTWVDVCEISAGSFTVSKKYLILAEAFVKCNSGADNLLVRLVHGTTPTVFTDASLIYEVTATNQKVRIGILCVFTQPGTAELVKLQIANSASSTTTCDLGHIFALKLDDDFTENTDYYYNEVTADYTTTTSFVAQAAVTFTPNGTDDWLIIGNASITPGSVTTPYRMSLHDSVEGLDEPSLEEEGEEASVEVRGINLMRCYTPSNASHTFSVRFNHTTTAATVLSSRIFAINLTKFKQHAYTYAAAEDTPATTPSWTTTRTLSVTPDATGDFFIMGYLTVDIGTSGNVTYTRMQVNNGGGLASDPNYGDDGPGIAGWDSSDQNPTSLFKFRSLTSGASRTINYDAQTVSGTTQRAQERCLLYFSLELAETNVTVTPAAATCVAAVVAPTVVQGSLTLAPSAVTCVVTVVAPTVVQSSMSVAPNPATCVVTVVDPTVVLGALSLAPNPATCVVTVVDPTVVLGALSLAPNPASCVVTVVDPTVSAGGNVDVTPTPVFSVATVVDPTVVQGSLSLAPSAVTCVVTVVAPTVVQSSMSVAPNPATCVVTVVAPTVLTAGGFVEAGERNVFKARPRDTFESALRGTFKPKPRQTHEVDN